MKKKRKNFKEDFIEFFKELSAAFLLCLIFLALLVIGGILISLFPEKISVIFPVEVVVLVGFFALLALLYVLSKIIDIVRKKKQKSSNTDNSTAQDEK